LVGCQFNIIVRHGFWFVMVRHKHFSKTVRTDHRNRKELLRCTATLLELATASTRACLIATDTLAVVPNGAAPTADGITRKSRKHWTDQWQ
jgi:environmental stress-induced protein Ves